MQEVIAQQLVQAADNLTTAFGKELERTYQAKDMNEAVMEMLPEKDQRGTLDWWGAFCRQYTGRSFLDSGGHYGYTFERPVAPEPLYLNTYRGAPEYFSISTPHFLHGLLDATDEVAVAIEELLYWYGDNVAADRSWCRTDEEFANGVLSELTDFAPSSREDEQERVWATQDLEAYLMSLDPQHFYGPSRWDKDYGLPEDWADTFPWSALDTVAQAGSIEPGRPGGGNTYNWDNDLDQVIQFQTVTAIQGYRHWGDHYIIVQAHTGCDVRGGYTKPVVALMKDYEYFYSLNVDLYCNNCDSWWEMAYDYNKDLKKAEVEEPYVLVDGEPLDPEGGSQHFSYDRVQIRCPVCGELGVHASNPVLGF